MYIKSYKNFKPSILILFVFKLIIFLKIQMFQLRPILWISIFATFSVILHHSKISQAIPQSDGNNPRTTPIPPIYDYIPSKKKQHNAVLIFLHRAGLNGTEMKHWVQILIGATEFNHVKVIFPTAPVQSYTLLDKKKRNIWYDQDDFTFDAAEKLNSFKSGEKVIRDIVHYETNTGISPNRIIIGGFSMGGVMALHYGYRLSNGLGGVFVLSGFLPNETKLYDAIKESNQPHKPHLFMATGDGDEFIREKWCEHTFEKFQECGVKGEYYSVRKMLHTMSIQEMVRLWDWIHRIVPDGQQYDVQTTPEDSGTDEDYYGDRKYTKFQKIIV